MTASPRTSRVLLALLVTSATGAIATAQMQTCPGSGLSITGGRFGDAFSLQVAGPPNAAVILASDVSGGPISTPYGMACIGMTPSAVLTPLTLDATGHFGISGTIPLAGIFAPGAQEFVQAALAHPSLPGGFGITNGEVMTMRPPRLGIFRSPGTTPSALGTFDLIDPVTDNVVVSIPAVPYPGSEVVHLKRHGLFAWPVTFSSSVPLGTNSLNGAIYCVDDVTGTNVLTIPGAWSMPGPAWGFDDESGHVVVIETGSSPTYNRFWVKGYSLSTGAQISLGAVSSIGFSCRGVYPIPGTSLAYVASTDRFHVVDVTTATEVATVMLPGTVTGALNRTAFVRDGMLYCMTNTQIIAIDTTTHAILTSVFLAPNVTVSSPLGLGPGSQGPALWGRTYTSWTSGLTTIIEIPLSTLTPIPAATTPMTGLAIGTPSAGGTEMIFQDVNSIMVGLVMNVATHATVSFSGTSIGISCKLCVVPSDTLTKAYGFAPTGFSGPGSVLNSFQTDPFVGIPAIVPLPAGPTAYGMPLSN